METINRRKPILIIGGQGVGKTTKARELAKMKPGDDFEKIGTESAFNMGHGVALFHYSQFGNIRIVDDIFEASVLMAVWKKASHTKEFRYIAVSQTGGRFRLPEGVEDYFEIIDLGALQATTRVEEAPAGFVRYESPAATLYGERAVVSIRQEGGQDQFRITLAKTKRGDVKACSLDRKELENLRDNINHVLIMSPEPKKSFIPGGVTPEDIQFVKEAFDVDITPRKAYPGNDRETIFFATSNEAEPVFTKSDLEKAYSAGGGAFRSFDHFLKRFKK